MQKIFTPLSIVLAGLIIAASNLYVNGLLSFSFLKGGKTPAANNLAVSPTPGQGAPAVKAPVKEIPLGDSPVLGKSEAKVTVIVFSDFQCPFCAAAAGVKNEVYERMKTDYPSWEPVLPNLKKDYVDQGLVRLVYKNFAFLGDESTAAANAAYCAKDQGKFWEYHDQLFANQKGENQGAFKEENLRGLAAKLGLNLEKFNQCQLSKTYSAGIAKETGDARGYGVTGTPAFYVNNQVIPGGAVPYSFVKEAIERSFGTQ